MSPCIEIFPLHVAKPLNIIPFLSSIREKITTYYSRPHMSETILIVIIITNHRA